MGHEKKEADTHVEFSEAVLSDAGSTPAASTIPFGLISLNFMSQAFQGPQETILMHISPRMITLIAFLVFVAWMIWLTITKRKL